MEFQQKSRGGPEEIQKRDREDQEKVQKCSIVDSQKFLRRSVGGPDKNQEIKVRFKGNPEKIQRSYCTCLGDVRRKEN